MQIRPSDNTEDNVIELVTAFNKFNIQSTESEVANWIAQDSAEAGYSYLTLDEIVE